MKRVLALALIVALVSIGVPTASFAGPRVNSSVTGIAFFHHPGHPGQRPSSHQWSQVLLGHRVGQQQGALTGDRDQPDPGAGDHRQRHLRWTRRLTAPSCHPLPHLSPRT